jgi:small-conductance mechanosensitive channel/CRP-like cAMP-binding protein
LARVALSEHWLILLLGVGVVLTAFLINRFAPQKRRRIRRLIVLYSLYLVAAGLRLLLELAHQDVWGGRAAVVASLFEAFILINFVAMALFDVALPVVRVQVATIASDLVIGLAYIVATLLVLHGAGVNPSSVVATSAVVSGVLALSLQATLGNILGGVALQLDGSIHPGDWIQLESGRQGKVKEIRWRHTVVETRDWSTIVVPNAALLAGNIMILGKRAGEPVPQRMWVYFCIDFRYPPSRVVQVVNHALRESPIERVAEEPKPNCICFDFSRDGRDSYAYYAVRYWLTDLAVDDPTSSAVRERIYSALKREDIPLARPSRTIFTTPEDEASEGRRAARHRDKRLAALRAMELFKPLTEGELGMLADHLHEAPYCAGERITQQGEVAHWLFIMTRGEADIRVSVDGAPPRTFKTIAAPDFFGEMGLMTGEPRVADVVAISDAECFRLDKAGFEGVLRGRPEIARELSKILAQRRVVLEAVREGLDAEARRAREVSEGQRILERIEEFFGLSS